MEPVKPAKKKRGLGKILLTVLIILLFSIGAAAFVFREEIVLLYKAITTSSESVASQQIENDKKTQELLNSVVEVTMHDLSDEERKQLADGLLTPEQALAIILGKTPITVTTEVSDVAQTVTAPDTTEPEENDDPPSTSVPTPPEQTKEPADTTVETTAPPVTTTETETTVATTTVATTEEVYIDPVWGKARIEEIVAEIYLLRATYLNEIDKLIHDGRMEYMHLPKGQHTLTNKFTIIERMLADGEKLEKQCDASMNKLLAELEKILKALDSPTDIIKEIRATYAEQKQLKKTELYNQYAPKLMK